MVESILCQRCEDVSDSSIGRRLDKIIRTCFEALRQDLRSKYIATGRLLRNEGSLSILCGHNDFPGYVYYGPYLNIINAKVTLISIFAGLSCQDIKFRYQCTNRLF